MRPMTFGAARVFLGTCAIVGSLGVAGTAVAGTGTSASSKRVVVTAVRPARAEAGRRVAVYGRSLAQARRVLIHGVAARFAVVSNRELIARVPARATSGRLVVVGRSNRASGPRIAVTPTVSGFSPTSGGVGTAVTVTGTGFTTPCTAHFHGVPALSCAVSSSTTIIARVPPSATTGAISIATAGSTVTSSTSFTVSLGILLSAGAGPPSTATTVYGTGFSANELVDLYTGTTDQALVATDSHGDFTLAGFVIPASAQPGTNWVTAVERDNERSAQAPFTVSVNWSQSGWGPSGRAFNPFENTISPANVDQVTEAWATTVSPYGNPKPFVEYNGDLYAFDENEILHAYSRTGSLLWTAAPGSSFRFSQVAPVASNGNIVVGDANGLVTAYPSLCRSDGGVCTTHRWSVTVGTAVDGGLSAHAGSIYVPGGDGLVHVLNAVTGAAGPNITPFYTGPINQQVAFGQDNSAYMVQGSDVSAVAPDGGGGGTAFPNGVAISAPAVGDQVAYVTSNDGNLDEVPGGWVAAIGSAGCDVAPAYASSVVYAASCDTVGAYDPLTGATLWSITTSGPPQGLAIADGVLYACIGARIEEFDASYGGHLGSGAPCVGAPEIANGAVYTSGHDLTASTLGGATTTLRPARPDGRFLRPDRRLPVVRSASTRREEP